MSFKKQIFSSYLFNFILLFALINLTESALLVKAGGNINFSCDKGIFYITMDVSISGKTKIQYYPFILTLDSPENLQFKCMLEYKERRIFCFHSFSNEDDYIKEGDLFKFPISFPPIEGITWDYQTFLNEVFRRIYNSKFECGGEENELVDYNNRIWDLEGSIKSINNGLCEPASITGFEYHRYNFELTVSFTKGDTLNNEEESIFLLQDIWIPLTTEENDEDDSPFTFAFCGSKDKLTKESFVLDCYIPIELDSIFNDIIQINSFFDKVYIKRGKVVELISVYFHSKEIEDSLFEDNKGIICPINPVLTIQDQDSIIMGDYNITNQYSFYLIGTLTNGYYTFKNGTRVELMQTYKDIKFNLIIQDNFIDSDENDVKVGCVLPEGTPFDEEEEAIIKCTGKKTDADNIDIILNWNLKDNNNLKDIIIKWPKTHEAKRKNLYGYDIRGISIKQSDFGCRDNNFDFYVYIYDLGREPKLSFDLPLDSPKDAMAQCKLFDKTALKCSLDLRHKRISKGTTIMLPEKGIINIIETVEGNKINFLTDNFTEINNEKDLFVKTKEKCGDNVVVGTLKDMGMSHKSSVATYILIIIFFLLFFLGSAFYIAYKCKLRYDRGTKLTVNEETKNNSKMTENSVKK